MFDSKKIDAYFEGRKLLTPEKRIVRSGFSWSRFVKLGFPCFAAAIFGVMMVLPNIKKSVDIRNEITLPHKNEMEKLHAEQVVLNVTDKKNRVNQVWADNMDELEAGSGEIKINNPHAEVNSDSGVINISADIGFMNQNTKVLRLEENVKVVDEKNNTIQTSKATYDFENEYGFGDESVYAEGDWGNLSAQGFNFDKNAEILVLLGNSEINTEKGVLTAEKETQIFQKENKVISIGNAEVKQNEKSLKADKIVNYFSSGDKKELVKTEAFGKVKVISEKGTALADKAIYRADTGAAELFGNVVITSEKGVAKSDKAVYQANTGVAEMFGNVVITSEKGVAKSSRAVYNPKDNTVDLYDNVVLEQGDNFMYGQHAHTDLNTSISTMTADKNKGTRVSGTFYSKRKADNGKKTDK